MRTSLEKFGTLIELMALICLAILSERDFVGMVSVESITLWSDIGEKVWSTEWSRVEVERVMSKSRVWPESWVGKEMC